MFEKARLKLTFWYVFIIFLISGSFSLIFYQRTTALIWRQHDRIQSRIEKEGFFLPPNPSRQMHQRMSRIFVEDFKTAQKELARQLILINGLILFFTGSAAYFLAGKTLNPIKQVLETQKRFVADAAHELKTPVTALKTSLEVNLMDKKLDKSAQKILKENLEDVTSLESLIENLLKLAKSDGQKLALKPVSLKSVISKSLKITKPLASSKKITFKLNHFPSKLQVLGDSDSLTELFVIFLDNAIKFSPKKSTVRISVKRQSKTVSISIIDSGLGIPKHHLPHIFERFYRADPSRSKATGNGFGLGLSVAKKIVDAHQGKISVNSAPSQGSTFTITLLKAQSQ